MQVVHPAGKDEVGKSAGHILLKISDRALRDTIRRALQTSGFLVHAPEWEQPIDEARLLSADLVLIDYANGAGLDRLRVVRSMRPAVPTLVLGSWGATRALERSLSAGATEYLNKPTRTHDLLQACEKVLARSQGGQVPAV